MEEPLTLLLSWEKAPCSRFGFPRSKKVEMGTWGTAISSNDTYADIYSEFMDMGFCGTYDPPQTEYG